MEEPSAFPVIEPSIETLSIKLAAAKQALAQEKKPAKQLKKVKIVKVAAVAPKTIKVEKQPEPQVQEPPKTKVEEAGEEAY